jgi:hypothetical protein
MRDVSSDLGVGRSLLRHQAPDLGGGMHDRGVVAAPDRCPMRGSERSVNSRQRYMAICRAVATVRLGESNSSGLMLK